MSYPAGLYHSPEGSWGFMALLVHTYTSANGPMSGNRWDLQTLAHAGYTCARPSTLSKKWLPKQASKGLSDESYIGAEQEISLLD